MGWIIASIVLAVCLLLSLLFLWLTHPRSRRAEMVRFAERCRYFAHRGLHDDEKPENSLPAFAAAVEAGYGIELDVQLSSDGVPVVCHDDRLTRMCGVEGRVCDRTAAELCELPLAGREGVCIPTFADVLAAVGGRSPLIVEIKYAAGWQVTLEAAMALLDAYDGPYCIESFHPMVLSWLRRHRQRVLRGQLNMRLRGVLPRRTAFQVCGEWFLTNCVARPDFVAYNHRDKGHLPFKLQTRLFPAATYIAWTVRSEEEEREAGPIFDAIIFENYRPPVAGGNETEEAPKDSASESETPAESNGDASPDAPAAADERAADRPADIEAAPADADKAGGEPA
ncbi:MAG: glycerophosphodiester phosphodiesterase [Clostridia bacterium]|nr:glycerophosphodiester phosphodiesterase [Clostridia bacterium]